MDKKGIGNQQQEIGLLNNPFNEALQVGSIAKAEFLEANTQLH